MAKNKNTKNSKAAKPHKSASKPAPKATVKVVAKATKPAPKKDLKPQKPAAKPAPATKVVAKAPAVKETKKAVVVAPVKVSLPIVELSKEQKEAVRIAEEKAMSLNLRSFRNQQDVEKFYRFVVENDLRREAKMVLDKIFVEVASQKKKRRAAAKKK